MARSERAKALEAEQKAARQAAKLKKKTSTNPSDWGRFRQIIETFKMTVKNDPPAKWLLLGGFLLPIVVFTVLAFSFNLFYAIFGPLFGILAAMYILGWRARLAGFKMNEGKAGAGEIALNLLPKAWIKEPGIAINKQMDCVHRVIGPAGIVLIGDGQSGKITGLLESSKKDHERVAGGVPVTTILMGDGAHQVPLRKLTGYIRKLPKVIKPAQVTDVRTRLKALDSVRPKLPMPRGPMPNLRGARQAMRGR